MTQIDNSKVFLDGQYTDATVTLSASQTLKEGTVLGRNSSGKLVAFSTDLSGQSFNAEPLYVLARNITNTSSSAAVDIPSVRVFDGGNVDKKKLIFIKEDDAAAATVLDALKKNGITLCNVEELSMVTPLNFVPTALTLNIGA